MHRDPYNFFLLVCSLSFYLNLSPTTTDSIYKRYIQKKFPFYLSFWLASLLNVILSKRSLCRLLILWSNICWAIRIGFTHKLLASAAWTQQKQNLLISQSKSILTKLLKLYDYRLSYSSLVTNESYHHHHHLFLSSSSSSSLLRLYMFSRNWSKSSLLDSMLQSQALA